MTTTAPATTLDPRQTKTKRPVLLVIPPYHGLGCAALGVSQLKANLVHAGFAAEVLYLNMLFAQRIGPHLYEWLSGTGPFLLGDLLFSQIGHQRTDADLQRYIDEVLAGSETEAGLRQWLPPGESVGDGLRRLVREAEAFVREDAIPAILARDPWMVGLSSTFQANCSSITLIRALKRQRPDIVTVMGGANCEAEMGGELHRLYPEIDFVGRGECDITFVNLVRALQAGESGGGIDGIVARADAEAMAPSKPLHRPDLDAQPHADLSDYFEQLEQLDLRRRVEPGLVAETSRGCWWGAKQHCTFCAFNREGMVYRSKSPERALAEIKAQVDRYGVRRMEITDNILDMQYFKSVIPELAATKNRAEFFWETKANMSRENVRLMASAGVRWIQPGIESLSDRTLKLMRKGSTQLQNVQLLKYCTESGVRITWNWLFGFPGEDESELDKLANDVRAIHHLQAPSGTSVLYLEKFAPYHSSPEEWGLTGIKPAKAYAYVYPFAPESLDRIAFFFECDHFSAKEKGIAFGKLRKIVDGWRGAYPRSHFLAIPRRRSMILLDTRPCAKRFFRRLTGLQHRIYEYCWKIRGERDVQRAFEGEAPAEKISAILQSFVDDYLMLGGNGRYLALATDPRLGYRAFPRVFPGGSIAHGQPAPPRNEAPRAPRRRLGRRLLNVLTLRTPPQTAVRNFVMRRALAWGRTARAPYEIGEGPDAPRRDEGAMPAPEPSV